MGISLQTYPLYTFQEYAQAHQGAILGHMAVDISGTYVVCFVRMFWLLILLASNTKPLQTYDWQAMVEKLAVIRDLNNCHATISISFREVVDLVFTNQTAYLLLSDPQARNNWLSGR